MTNIHASNTTGVTTSTDSGTDIWPRYLALKRLLAMRDQAARLCERTVAEGKHIIRPLIVPNTQAPGILNYFSIDSCRLDRGQVATVSGWAFALEWDPRHTRVILELIGPLHYLLPTAPQIRADVAAAHEERPEIQDTPCVAGLQHSGFTVSFTTTDLAPGDYQIRVWLQNERAFLASPVRPGLAIGQS